MRKIFLFIVLSVLAVFSANAQQFAVSAGYTNNTTKQIYNSGLDYKVKGNGFFIQGAYILPLADSKQGYIQAGLRFDYVGTTSQTTATTLKGTNTFIGIPVHIGTAFDPGHEIVFGVYGGPTLEFGLSSKDRVLLNGQDTGKSVNYFDGAYGYKRLDVMLGAGVNIKFFNVVKVNVGYDLGLLNLIKTDNLENMAKRKNSRLNVGVSILF